MKAIVEMVESGVRTHNWNRATVTALIIIACVAAFVLFYSGYVVPAIGQELVCAS